MTHESTNIRHQVFSDVQRVYAYLGQHHGAAAGDGKPLVVSIGQREETRTKAQNRLIHMWFGDIAKRQAIHQRMLNIS